MPLDAPPSPWEFSAVLCDSQRFHPALRSNAAPSMDTVAVNEIAFETAAQQFVEALPLGNGILGAMCYGRLGGESLTINRHDGWSGNTQSPNQHVPAYKTANYLEQIRTLVADGHIEDAEELLKQAQSTHSQAFLPYVDIDVSVGDGDGSVGDGVTASAGIARLLNFTTAHAATTYTIDDTRVTHATYLPRTIPSQSKGAVQLKDTAQLKDSAQLIHIVTNNGPRTQPVTVTLSSLLRGFPTRNNQYLIELPSDVAPTHEANPQHIRYHGNTPRVGCVSVAAMITPLFPTGGAGTETYAANPAYSSENSAETDHPATETIPHQRTYQLPAHSALILVVDSSEIQQLRNVVATQLPQRRADITTAVNRMQTTSQQRAQQLAINTARDPHTVFKQHVRAHRALYDTMSLELPDLDVTKQFNFGRYLHISAYAPNALPINLQGLWCHDIPAPWSSNYTLNINTPMNYWGVEAAGLPQLHEPLITWLESIVKGPGKDAAGKLYGLEGFVLHHNADAWGHALPAGAGAGDASWAYWPLGGIWLTRHTWDHYDYSQDPAVLETIWPIIEAAGTFAAGWIVDGTDGTYTSPSVSPENKYLHNGVPVAVTTSATMDIALMHDLAQYAHAAHRELFGARAQQPHWLRDLTAKAARLPAYRIGAQGQLQEWQEDATEVEPQHRHLSHLVGIYPLGTITNQALLDAAATTLELRGKDSTGWSLAWRICLWARLGNAEMVTDAINRSLRPALPDTESSSGDVDGGIGDEQQSHYEHRGGIYPNLFSAHPPFQIDGNLGFVAGTLEALCSTVNNTVRVFPALPATWHHGSVRGLRLRGAYTVDLSWESPTSYTINITDTRKAGAPRNPTIQLDPETPITLEIRPQETFCVTHKKGVNPTITQVS